MNWMECIVHTTTEGADWVSQCLMDLGASGTMIEDKSDIPDPSKPHGYWEIIDPNMPDSMPEDVLVHAWFETDASLPENLRKLSGMLGGMRAKQPLYGSLQLDSNLVSEDSWNDEWKKYCKPFYAGKHTVIKPTWEDFDPAPGDHIIEMDPGMAFGSGTHETTGMCISFLEELIHGGERVIDVGTGSGILAIAAALLGAGHVLAVDIDKDAVRVAAENVRHNRVESVVSVQEGDLLKRVDETCDICIVNIIADIVVMYAAPLKAHIVPGGYLLCSGIVRDRTDEVREALLDAGYESAQTEFRGEWTAFLARRNG